MPFEIATFNITLIPLLAYHMLQEKEATSKEGPGNEETQRDFSPEDDEKCDFSASPQSPIPPGSSAEAIGNELIRFGRRGVGDMLAK